MKSQVEICSRHACTSTVLWLPFRFHIRADACVANVAMSIRTAKCREDAEQGLTCVRVLRCVCLRDMICSPKDQMVVEMIRSVGKVEHSDIRVNFREYVTMCWKWFFEEPPDTDEASDVRDAFLILGGGPGSEGQVETSKLKEFATELNLTIDVDKFVGEVDEDGSGKVDFGEFCKLFAASKVDSNLHDTGEIWLRNDKDETLAALARRNIGRSASPTGLTIDTDDPKTPHADAPGTSASRPSSAFFDARCTTAFLDGGPHEQPVKITRHREGFFGDDVPAHVNSGALLAPKMKKVLQSSAPKFDRRVNSNTGKTNIKRKIFAELHA
jgi:Ca2+-binding EF-hand superfamily protein